MAKTDEKSFLYKPYLLKSSTFNAEWRSSFSNRFKSETKDDDSVWLPEQIFDSVGKLLLYHPQPYYLRCSYQRFENVLELLGEDEFVVVDREYFDGNETGEYAGIHFVKQRMESGARDEGLYHIETQPLEFYMFGRRADWGFVSSEGYNIGILNAKGEALKCFALLAPGSPDEQIQEYLGRTPVDYRQRFRQNYLDLEN